MTQAKQSFYATGTKEAGRLDKEYGQKANVIQKAYEAAVTELGYSDKELMNKGNAKSVAKLMFSGKYLGDAKFNPMIGKGFEGMNDIDKQREYEHKLGVNLDSFVSRGGIISRYGGLKRSAIAGAVEEEFGQKTTQQLMSLAWEKVYDPGKSLTDNMNAYASELQKDPILNHTGAKINSGKFESIDEIAQTLASSMSGQTNRQSFHYKHGVDFN